MIDKRTEWFEWIWLLLFIFKYPSDKRDFYLKTRPRYKTFFILLKVANRIFNELKSVDWIHPVKMYSRIAKRKILKARIYKIYAQHLFRMFRISKYAVEYFW